MAAARRDDIEFAHDDEELPAAAVRRHAVRLRALEREPPRASPRDPAAWLAWAIVLALHLALLLVARSPRVGRPAEPASAIEVHLIEPAAPLPAEPLLPAPVARTPATRNRFAAPAAPAAAPPPAQAAAEAQPPLRLFDSDGSAVIPDGLANELDRGRVHHGFAQAIAPSPLLAPKRPLKVRPNHFAQYWAGTDGKPLHEAMWQHVIVTREFTAPWGGRWGCAWVLIIVACADIPDKPWQPPQTWKPATEMDER